MRKLTFLSVSSVGVRKCLAMIFLNPSIPMSPTMIDTRLFINNSIVVSSRTSYVHAHATKTMLRTVLRLPDVEYIMPYSYKLLIQYYIYYA